MLADLPVPVISAVHSHCYTWALGPALAGDIILAAESARFGDSHAGLALTPVCGLNQRQGRDKTVVPVRRRYLGQIGQNATKSEKERPLGHNR